MLLLSKIREQKLLDMNVELEEYIKANNITEESMIFSMAFEKEVYASKKEVVEYLNDKGFYDPEIIENDIEFEAVIISPNQIDAETELSVELRRGVKAKAGNLLNQMSMEEITFNEKGEINLSSKFNDKIINLNDGLPHIIEVARVCEGEHPAYGKLKITQEHLQSFVNNFKSNAPGVDLAVNEDHKKSEAFGWFKDIFLSYDKQVLYGQVRWNAKGTTALSEREYRYFSPEFRFNYVHPHTNVEHGPTLLGGALTNYPFLKMEAIVELNNKKQNQPGVRMTKEIDNTISLNDHNKVIIELNAKNVEVQGKLDASEARAIELNAKLETLETEKKQADLERANEKLFSNGKINKAQLVALNEGKGLVEVLDLATTINTEAQGTTGKIENVELSEGDKVLAKKFGMTEEEYLAGNKGA